MTERRLWLIDAGYFFKAQRCVGERYFFDYKRLRERLEADAPLWRAYYFNSVATTPNAKQEQFHNWLEFDPSGPKIVTKLYRLKPVDPTRAYCTKCAAQVRLACPRCGLTQALQNFQQKGDDVGIATTALTLVDEYDTLILSSGDGDLLDAVEHLTRIGRRVELLVFRAGVSFDLQARASRIHWINDFADEVRRT